MITKAMIKKIAPTSKDAIVDPLIIYLNMYVVKYKVNTHLRICHFLAQAAHESAGFRTLREFASGKAYEGRKDLGNTVKGDGVRFKGRGIFQLTGRANYRDMGKRLGKDLEKNPALAETPEISVLTALEYWNSRSLSTYADKDDIRTITKKINGGYNGLADRKKYYAKAKAAVPKNIKFVESPSQEEPPETVPVPVPAPAPVPPYSPIWPPYNPSMPPPPNNPIWPPIVIAKRGDDSPYIGDLQRMLIAKGLKLEATNVFDEATEAAVREFQKKYGLFISGMIDTDTLNRMMIWG